MRPPPCRPPRPARTCIAKSRARTTLRRACSWPRRCGERPGVSGGHAAAEPAALRVRLRTGSHRQDSANFEVYAHPAGTTAMMSGWLPRRTPPPRRRSTGTCTWDRRPGVRSMRSCWTDSTSKKAAAWSAAACLEWGSHCVDLCQWAVGDCPTAQSNTMPRTRPIGGPLRQWLRADLRREAAGFRWGRAPCGSKAKTGWVEAGDSGKLVVSSPALAGRENGGRDRRLSGHVPRPRFPRLRQDPRSPKGIKWEKPLS